MVRCSIMGCKSDSERKFDGLSFHSFPDDPKLRNLWIAATNRINWNPKRSSKICCEHFESELLWKIGNKTFLKPYSVPTKLTGSECEKVNGPSCETDVQNSQLTCLENLDIGSLENDMQNYMEYKIMGSIKKILMKPDCVPSRFNIQMVEKRNPSHTSDHTYNKQLDSMDACRTSKSLSHEELSKKEDITPTCSFSFGKFHDKTAQGVQNNKQFCNQEVEVQLPQSQKRMPCSGEAFAEEQVTPTELSRAMRPKTSDIWQYFLAIDGDFAQCKICGNKYSRKGRTTTSLRTHLKAIHKDIYEENTNVDQSENVTLAQPSLVTNTTQLQKAERQLLLAESWHKEKYEELCKIQEQEVEVKLEQPWSDTSTTPSIHYEPYCEQLCEIEVKNENMESEQSSLDIGATTLQQAKRRLSVEVPSENNQMWDSSHPKANKMDDMIGEMIILQNLPFHFVEGIGFRRVMETAMPNYRLRGSEFFSNRVCDTIYNKVESKVRLMLRKCSKLSFTVDISESSGNGSLMTLTAHGISEEFGRLKIILKCCLLQEKTGEMICENFKIMLRDWNIPDEHCHCFVRNGSNLINAIHLASLPDVKCPIYQLQLCVRAALETLELKNLLAKCRDISGHFNHSRKAQDELDKIQKRLNQPILRVIHDSNNRWVSTYCMLERLLKIQDAISLYTSKHNIPQILPDESLLLKKIIEILHPFEEVTRILGDKKTCISSVIPMIYALKQTLLVEKDKSDTNHEIKNIIKKLVEDINYKFGDLSNNLLYSLATYLDPRYKLKFFNKIVKEQVQTKLLCLLAQHDVEAANASGTGSGQPLAKKFKVSYQMNPGISFQILPTKSVHSNLSHMLNSCDDDEETEESSMDNKKFIQWKLLINEYNKEKRLQVDEDPLLWWRYNTKYKDLAPITRIYLSPPASSVNEQLLSEDVSICGPLRNELDDDKAEKLLFVKYNLPLLNFDY